MQEKEALDKKEAVRQIFPLILPNYQMLLTPRAIILKNDDNNVMIDETNFEPFQNILGKNFLY
jgi:hypothetical protein